MQKTVICFVVLSFICGCLVTGLFFGPDRRALEQSRAEATEYRSRAELSEARIAECQDIIVRGEAGLGGSISTIQQAIQQVREIRDIISKIKTTIDGSVSQ